MQNRHFLPTLTMLLFLVLVVFALLFQRFIDTEELNHAATAPHYTGSQSETATQDTQTTPDTPMSHLVDAPDVEVYDANGKKVKLSDFEGKPVVLNFWASWNNLSKLERHVFQAHFEARRDDVIFLMINVTDGTHETLETAKEYWASLDTEMLVCYDTDHDAVESFGITSIPVTYFINAQGKIVYTTNGKISTDTLERSLRMCLPDPG